MVASQEINQASLGKPNQEKLISSANLPIFAWRNFYSNTASKSHDGITDNFAPRLSHRLSTKVARNLHLSGHIKKFCRKVLISIQQKNISILAQWNFCWRVWVPYFRWQAVRRDLRVLWISLLHRSKLVALMFSLYTQVKKIRLH